MKNTEFNINSLISIISPETSLPELISMIDDMGLEMVDVENI
jgi:hypothetical protein